VRRIAAAVKFGMSAVREGDHGRAIIRAGQCTDILRRPHLRRRHSRLLSFFEARTHGWPMIYRVYVIQGDSRLPSRVRITGVVYGPARTLVEFLGFVLDDCLASITKYNICYQCYHLSGTNLLVAVKSSTVL